MKLWTPSFHRSDACGNTSPILVTESLMSLLRENVTGPAVPDNVPETSVVLPPKKLVTLSAN
jgi:hypothetical protein